MLISQSQHPSGFTYIGLLIVVVISGIALTGVGVVWHQDIQREREKELLFIGEAYLRGIASYYENSPGEIKQFPQSLDDLVSDHRFPITKRHLRRLYPDPLTPNKPWGLILQQGQVAGVYSQSELQPVKRFGFTPQFEAFSTAKEYRDWKFVYIPGSLSNLTVLSDTE